MSIRRKDARSHFPSLEPDQELCPGAKSCRRPLSDDEELMARLQSNDSAHWRFSLAVTPALCSLFHEHRPR